MDNFFAIMSRMKYISRWSLMRNLKTESLSEHTFEVVYITHALSAMRNAGGGAVDEGEAVLYALYHDISETLTGDMPTPVKYHNDELKNAYKSVEAAACDKLCAMVPPDIRKEYKKYLSEAPSDIQKIVKAADKLSALIKCIEEKRMGNTDFEKAEIGLRNAIYKLEVPEAVVFMEEYLSAYGLCVDEL